MLRLKRTERNLTSDEYSKNLISVNDKKVLTALNQQINSMRFRPVDNVAVFWIDSTCKY